MLLGWRECAVVCWELEGNREDKGYAFGGEAGDAKVLNEGEEAEACGGRKVCEKDEEPVVDAVFEITMGFGTCPPSPATTDRTGDDKSDD